MDDIERVAAAINRAAASVPGYEDSVTLYRRYAKAAIEEMDRLDADLHRGAVEALREAVEAARLFNRRGMTWREYDALLARLEHDHLGGSKE
jgi:hypothetical protein